MNKEKKMQSESDMFRNEYGGFSTDYFQITSGMPVEIKINDSWLLGVTERWGEVYCWFSKVDEVAVILKTGILARLPMMAK